MKILHRFLALFRRAKLDSEMDAEMRAHLERETEQNIARGLSPDEARCEARRGFGGLDQLKERERDARGVRWLETTLRDVRHTLRALRQSPVFTAVAVVSLALAIGAGTAVFSVFNAVMLRSLPVPDPQELRELRWAGREVRIPSQSGGDSSFTPPALFQLREQAAAQADIFGFIPVDEVMVRAGSEVFSAEGAVVSDNFFSGLRVQPVIGRPLLPGEDFAGTGTRIVISDDWWERHFTRDPAVLGQSILLNDTAYTVVGVLPRGFEGVQPGQSAGFYVPMSVNSRFLYREITSTFHWYVRLMARLRPGVSDAQLEAALDVVVAREFAEFMQEPRAQVVPGRGGVTYNRDHYRQPLLLMLGVVGMVTLVACANLAGLSLARGVARQHELAVRAALGAGRWRLVRQSLTESLVLAGIGCGLGMLLAIWMRPYVARLLGGSAGALRYDFSLDLTVLAFVTAAALITAVLAGLLPALRAGRVDPLDGLKSRGALGAPRLRIGRILVGAQICVSLLLLTGAVLYGRTLVNLARIDAGFDTDGLLLVQLNRAGSDYANTQPAGYLARVQDALAALPGVRAATLVEFPLLSGSGSSGSFSSFSGRPSVAGESMDTRRLTVGETFFDTIGVSIVQGRGLAATDTEGAPKVIVVNESFVRKYLPNENPLGLTIPVWSADWQIVGVCRDIKYNNVRTPEEPTTYFPFRQRFYSRFRTHLRSPYFAVRTTLPPMSIVPAVRRAVLAIDANVVLTDITTQDDVRDSSIGQERLFALLSGSLAGLALFLACIGLYGLMAYHVSRRTSEFGIRMALGAQPTDIARPILREALVLATVGLAAGLPAVFAGTRLIRSQLYGVEPNDPLVLVLSMTAILCVALAAAWIPAHRAAKVDPLTALRAE